MAACFMINAKEISEISSYLDLASCLFSNAV